MYTHSKYSIGNESIHGRIKLVAGILTLMLSAVSCNKLVNVPEPINTVTTLKVFKTDDQANSAMAGVLTQMINGNSTVNSAYSSFSAGLSTLAGGYSSDELLFQSLTESSYSRLNNNSINATIDGTTNNLWTTAYNTIYGSNAIIEGIQASGSASLRERARSVLTGEAKFLRAFSYFYLVNFYGEVPLALTIDFNETANMPKTAVATIYKQIVADLLAASDLLPDDYQMGAGERIRPNKWAAKALLARVYLFTGENAKAAETAGEVIGHTALYNLETTDLNKVFLSNSTEAIWQLQQNTSMTNIGNATAEGASLLPNPLHTGLINSTITASLLASFETGDLRRKLWIDSTINVNGTYYYPYKYKTGFHNYTLGGVATEYYMVLRLAEQYLIRAEANALGNKAGPAIDDLNILRHRAGLNNLPSGLSGTALTDAIAKERRNELFMEWGHRWFDLKRTGRAHDVLSAISYKQPWKGDYQLLYPLPIQEIQRDHFLEQNKGY